MNLFPVLFSLLIGFYSVILVLIIAGLFRLKKGTSSKKPFVSIVIAARNEEENLPACLDALVAQTYPAKLFEIIVVNDRSSDGTLSILEKSEQKYNKIQWIDIRKPHPQMAPKKWALDQGIRQAKGEIILTTDADCQPPKKWIESVLTFFEDDVGLVAGFSPLTRMEKLNLFHSLLVLDSMALAGVAAGSIGFGFPLTCNGRNLAYRKSVFIEVGGFESIARFVSGDDDLFLHRVKKNTKWKIRYAADKNAAVPSRPPEKLWDFIQQRLRHASKGRSYAWGLRLGLVAVYLMNLVLILALMLSEFHSLFLNGFIIKSVLEFFIVWKMAHLFGQKRWLSVFPVAMILHPFYVVVLGLWGQIGQFHWKGSSYKSKISE